MSLKVVCNWNRYAINFVRWETTSIYHALQIKKYKKDKKDTAFWIHLKQSNLVEIEVSELLDSLYIIATQISRRK